MTGVDSSTSPSLSSLTISMLLLLSFQYHLRRIEYRFRVYPNNELLTHPFEMGMMLWL